MEDYATILLTFRNGVTAAVEVNWLTPVKIRTLGITCTMKYLNIDYTNQTVEVASSTVMDLDPANLSHIPIESDRRRICLKKEEPLKNELLDFLGAIEHDRPPLVGGIDGVMAVSAAATALKSLASGVVVDV
jgi:UDP-N-acetylglucosamine 3-dehydrogenase